MTLFYLKWEEFFGAWLEKHGQSILIVYGPETKSLGPWQPTTKVGLNIYL